MGAGPVLRASLWRKITDHERNSGAPANSDLCGCLMGAGPVLQVLPVEKDYPTAAVVHMTDDLAGV
jgi:hypothetical protein